MTNALKKTHLLRLGIPDPLLNLNPSARPLFDLGGAALLRPNPPEWAEWAAAAAARFEVDRAEVIEPDWAGGLDICLAIVKDGLQSYPSHHS